MGLESLISVVIVVTTGSHFIIVNLWMLRNDEFVSD